MKRFINPSFEINQYITYINDKHLKYNYNNKYFDINESKYIYKKILFSLLNNSSFNIDLFVEENNWIDIISYIFKWNLIISPKFINYMFNLINEKKQRNILFILNIHKNYFSEISFCNFNEDIILNKDNIDRIMFILKKIFESKQENNKIYNSKLKINNEENKNEIIEDNIIYNNNNHNVKKISFTNNIIPFLNKFFNELDDIISLSKIEELSINAKSLSPYQFGDMITLILKKMKTLKYLKITNFGIYETHFINFKILCYNSLEHIERLDLSDTCTSTELIKILNNKKYPLKELKIYIFSKENEINFNFLEKNIETIEILKLKLILINPKKSLDKIVNILNKMKKLKNLSLIGGIEPSQLFNFNNFMNIEYLYLDININIDTYNKFKNIMINYFTNFKNLKTLKLKKKISLQNNDNFFIFNFPPKLINIFLENITGYNLLNLLNNNKQYLKNIQEFQIKKILFEKEELSNLISLFSDFKSLNKLSINKINIQTQYNEIISIYDFMSKIFKYAPSLTELDLSNNTHEKDLFIQKDFETIINSKPAKLLNLKIFN